MRSAPRIWGYLGSPHVVIPNCKDLPSKCASLRFNCNRRRPVRSSSFSHKITPEDARLLGRVIFFRDDGASLRHPGITGLVWLPVWADPVRDFALQNEADGKSMVGPLRAPPPREIDYLLHNFGLRCKRRQ